jgi:hypothetical protein
MLPNTYKANIIKLEILKNNIFFIDFVSLTLYRIKIDLPPIFINNFVSTYNVNINYW